MTDLTIVVFSEKTVSAVVAVVVAAAAAVAVFVLAAVVVVGVVVVVVVQRGVVFVDFVVRMDSVKELGLGLEYLSGS